MVKYCLDEIKARLKTYVGDSDIDKTVIVNVNNSKDYIEMKNYLTQLMTVKILNMSDYCLMDDTLPNITNLMEQLESKEKRNVAIFGISETLDLLNDKSYFNIFLEYTNKILIITYKEEILLNEILQKNPRIEGKNQIWFLDSEVETVENISVVDESLKIEDFRVKKGLKSLIYALENKNYDYIFSTSNTLVYNNTKVNLINSVFEYICYFDKEIEYALNESMGTEDQWRMLLKNSSDLKSISQYLKNNLGYSNYSDDLFININDASDDVKWYTYIYLKLLKKNVVNRYCALVLENSKNEKEFNENLANYIMKIEINDIDKYCDYRKVILKNINFDDLSAENFIKLLEDSKNRIYYLTDITIAERKEIIALYSKYEYDGIKPVLREKYKDLFYYLDDSIFKFKDSYYNNYFDKYIECKLKNNITEEFRAIVDEIATNRRYLQLPTRVSLVEKNYNDNTLVYFIDCLGAEFIRYIYNKTIEELELDIEFELCRANLPSITTRNDEYKNEVSVNNLKINKDLDILIHKDNDDKYQNQPVYLAQQLEIIHKILLEIKRYILSGNYEKVIVITDHGSSRLARIENSDDINTHVHPDEEKGKHSGRCCKCDEKSIDIDVAVYEGGHYCLTNYNRFKYGNKTGVELHGGASLEEVVIPFITFAKKGQKVYNINLQGGNNFKIKNGKIKVIITSNYILKNPSIVFENKSYDLVEKNSIDKIYELELIVNRAMECNIQVRENGSFIASFDIEIENSALKENKLF